MKVVVIGGSGLIGTKLVKNLQARGYTVVAASPASGVNTITGQGVAEALAGATVVVDVANSPSSEDNAAMQFFATSGHNLLSAGAVAGVKHHVALSIVGVDRLSDSGYLRAKLAQEALVKASSIPYTIVRSTQFFEFLPGLAQTNTHARTVRLSPALFQPIAAEDVAAVLTDVALGAPTNSIVEVAGPERVRMAQLVEHFLCARQDRRTVLADPHAAYFGVELNNLSLLPGDGARIGATRFEDWLPKAA
jgi:uncharacterized protein YbjT (DUF2867 family)